MNLQAPTRFSSRPLRLRAAGPWLLGLALAIGPVTVRAAENAPAPPAPAPLAAFGSRGIHVHDPSTIVKCRDEYWLFATGRGLPSWHSKDLQTWVSGPPVFTQAPSWVAATVPGNRGLNFWAPDVRKLGDRYVLYYSVSTFGKRVSAIGLATNRTLDPADPDYRWVDAGIVVRSTEADDFNAIDPCITTDADGRPWLSFGSFWSGIKLIPLDPTTGLRPPDGAMRAIAYNRQIEASFIFRHGGYYYLFVNWGLCCRGVNSTYEIRVGRSREITGAYVDKEGRDLLRGGGTLLLGTDKPFIGPGHAGILVQDGNEWFSCHFYDGTDPRGPGTLAIRPLTWDEDGWPIVGLTTSPR